MGARLFWCDSRCAVTEEQIKKYIENQSDEPGSFKVWDEPEEPEKDMADL